MKSWSAATLVAPMVVVLLGAGPGCGGKGTAPPDGGRDAGLDAGLGGSADSGGGEKGDGGDKKDGGASFPVTCSVCHGTAQSPAPPADTDGNTATTAPGVGAHQAHLRSSVWHGPVACNECHVVPTIPNYDSSVPTHMNGKDDVVWGPLARQGSFDAGTNSCAGTYCHGATLAVDHSGASSLRSPKWTQVDGSQSACGTACHTNPPGGAHPDAQNCESCHGDVIASFKPGNPPAVIWANANLHINGAVDVTGAQTCTTCHGSATRAATTLNPQLPAAPPLGSKGETQTTARAVGAHQAHLNDGTLAKAMACTECHVVPTSTSHANGTVDMKFGALASTGGVTPAWNGSTCANSYCHGNFKNGATSNAPNWTAGNQAVCGSCHALPPGGSHPTGSACQNCHAGYTASSVNLATHMNGVVDVTGAQTCTTCHGSAARAATTLNPQLPAAPPLGSKGETQTTARAVGAHQAHLNDGTLAKAMACTECHVVPTSTSHANGTVDMKFGVLASTGGVTPAWNGSTCANSYCHGNFKNGATSNAPNWTAGNQAVCGSCHALPPGGSHPTGSACQNCHAGYTASSVNLATHLNGVVDVTGTQTCTTCHGSATRAATTLNPQLPAAPPLGSKGETQTTARAVGAHQSHLNDGTMAKAMACTECHVVPTSTSHANGTVDMKFGTLASTGGVTPAWNGSTCANSYCHGNFKNGTTGNAPNWTASNQAVCGSCHALPPGGSHPTGSACQNCHAGYTASSVNLATHMNGVVDVTGTQTCTTCHGSATRAATTLNPQLPAAPPLGSKGETLTTARAVGAHQAHLNDGTMAKAMACTECHVVPTSTSHANGTVDMKFGTLASTGGVTPAWNGSTCANSYCHGNFKNGTTGNAPNWTASNQAVCGSCHALPPGGSHPTGSACQNCHAGYTASSVNLATHLNGVVDVTGTQTCTSCHGSATRAATTLNPQLPAAPPLGSKGETLTTARAVGAHQAHLNDGTLAKAMACTECHVVPTSTSHANGTVDMKFGTLASTGGVTPAWNGSTCAKSYCHGNFTNGTTGNAPNWTASNQAACGSCHGLAPNSGQHAQHSGQTCSACHGSGYSSSAVNTTLHVNGVVNVGGSGSSITSYSGGSCTPTCHRTRSW